MTNTSMQELLNRHVTLVENHIRRVSDNDSKMSHDLNLPAWRF